MGNVTTVILTFSGAEDEEARMQEVNSFRYGHLKMNLVSVDYNKDMATGMRWYGGTKFIEGALYLGAFNYLDLQEFMQHLQQVKWEEPEEVQLIVKEQWDCGFRILTIV